MDVFSSVFTSRVTKTIPIPHDEGQSVTIRKLAPRHLEQAAKESQRQSFAELREMGGAAFLKELRSLNEDDIKTATARDPLMLFDRITLMEKAVLAWTYVDVERTRETFEDLDDDTQVLLATEILKLSKPSLFVTKTEEETERKNG